MLSLFNVTFVATLITITSALCPFVANYYYKYSDESKTVRDIALINDCRAADDQFNGISYSSEKFTCHNNEVYINKYIGTTCSGQPPFTAKLGPAPTNLNSKYQATYRYSCNESTPCYNAFHWIVSNKSYQAAYGTDEILYESICLDYTDDNFGYVFPIGITGICIDTSYGLGTSSTIWNCDATGIYQFIFQGSSQCAGTPQQVKHIDPYGCSIDFNLYTKMTYCNGHIYNDIPISTTNHLPTQMPANIPTQISGNIPTEISGNIPSEISWNIPTEISGNIPTEISENIPTEMPVNPPTNVIHKALVPIHVNSNGIPKPRDPTINQLLPGNTGEVTSVPIDINYNATDVNSTDIDIVNAIVTVPNNNNNNDDAPAVASDSNMEYIWIIGAPVGGVLICAVVATYVCKKDNRLNALYCKGKRRMTADHSSDDDDEEEDDV